MKIAKLVMVLMVVLLMAVMALPGAFAAPPEGKGSGGSDTSGSGLVVGGDKGGDELQCPTSRNCEKWDW
jgi:hypothetical protein